MHLFLELSVYKVHVRLDLKGNAPSDQIEGLLLLLYERFNVNKKPPLALLHLLLKKAEDSEEALSELINDQGPFTADGERVLLEVGHVLIDKILLFSFILE